MNEQVIQATRLIEAFLSLMLERRVPVHWDNYASMDNAGGVHLPIPRTGDAAEIALLTRLAVHEGGHVLETEPGFSDRLTKEELGVFNALEDPRMESRQVRRYPGASLILSRGLDEMLQNIEDHFEVRIQAPGRAMQLDLLLRGLLSVAPHGPILRRAPPLLQRLDPLLSQAQRDAIDEAVDRLPALDTSLDAEEVARAMLARLREPADERPARQGGGDSGDDQEQSDPQPEGSDGRGQEAADDSTGKGGDDDGAALGPADPTDQNAAPDAKDHNPEEPGAESESDAARGAAPHAEAIAQPAAGENGGGEDGNGPQTNPEFEALEQESTSTPQGGGCSGDPVQDESSGAMSINDHAGQPPGGNSAGLQGSREREVAGGQPCAVQEPADLQQRMSHSDAGLVQNAAQTGGETADAMGSARESIDLGALLRETLAERFGPAQQGMPPIAAPRVGADPLTDEELQRVEVALAQAAPSVPLEELVRASLAALGAGQGADPEDGTPGKGAGMALATATSTQASLAETRLQGVQSRLVTVLQRELQDRRRRPWRPAYSGGRVMTQRFWRLGALGDTKVFVQKRNASGIDAAATVLLDSSYSMQEQLRTAAEVTMAFSLALQRLGVHTRVLRFPGVETVTVTLQRFGEPARSCVHRCATLAASGGTPVGAAVVAELPLLMLQRRLKNILVIVTDDDPGDQETLAAALASAEELGVLVVGVGISCDIRSWIRNAVSVQDVNELPHALARLFQESISETLAA
jgi:hypothetical protein